MKKLANLLMFLSQALLPSRGFAGEPTAQLSATINEFVTIMVNTPVSEPRTTGLPEKALKLIHSRFDFTEMTKRSLGPHWKALAPAEQGEFVDSLTYRLLVTYGRTVRTSGDEKVVFKKKPWMAATPTSNLLSSAASPTRQSITACMMWTASGASMMWSSSM